MHIYCKILLTTCWELAVDASIQTVGGKPISFDNADTSPTRSHTKLYVWRRPWACLFCKYTGQSLCYNVRQSIDYSGLLSGLINLAQGFICWKHFTVDDLLLTFGLPNGELHAIYLMQINSWFLGFLSVMGLDGMELPFFIASHVGLCLRFKI